MEMEYVHGQMADVMKANTKMILSMVRVNIPGPMVIITMEVGMKVKYTALVRNLTHKLGLLRMEGGNTVAKLICDILKGK